MSIFIFKVVAMPARFFLIVLLVCDMISSVSAQTGIINTVAGTGAVSHSGDGGFAVSAGIGGTSFIVFDRWGNYYFFSTTYRVRKVDTFGIISTVAGNGTSGGGGDGGSATSAQLSQVSGLAVDDSGNIYITDVGTDRVRRVNAATGVITTIAGTGTPGFSGDSGPATSAMIADPYGGCLDTAGNYYFADRTNLRIRKIDRSGIITTIAGTGTASSLGSEGRADTINFLVLYGMCADRRDNIYLCDGARVRKINLSSNMLSNIAGNGTTTSGGDGGAAISAGINPDVIYIDIYGNLFINSSGNHNIRMVDTFDIIHLVAGMGSVGFSGDGGRSDTARLSAPRGMAKDRCGNLLICDNSNFRIRKVAYNPHCWPLDVPDAEKKPELSVYPNPATATLHITGAEATTTYVLYAVTGQVVATGMLLQGDTEIGIEHIAPGMYLLQLQDASGVRSTHKVVKE